MFALLFILPLVASFSVYDCTAPSTQGTYKLLSLDDCLNSYPTTTTETPTTGSLLQIPSVVTIPGVLLEIAAASETSYCTYNRLRTKLIVPKNYDAYTPSVYPLSTVAQWIRTNEIKLNHRSVNIQYNTLTTVLDTDQVDEDGFCKSWQVTIKFIAYRILVRVIDIQVLLNPDGSVDSLAAFSETVKGNPTDGIGSLESGAYLQWDPKDIKLCPWESVYSGQYTIASDSASTQIALFPSISAGLVLGEKKHVCDHQVHPTNHPQLYVSVGHIVGAPSLDLNKPASWSALIRSAIQYSNTISQTAMLNLTRSIQVNQCILEQQIQRETLFSAATSPELVGYRLSGALGSAIVVAGGAVQILKCTEINAKLELRDDCYNLVPIILTNSNQSAYMDPVTRVVKHSASKIPCHDLQVPYFEMRGIWYRLMPHQSSIPEPPVLPSDLRAFTLNNLTTFKGLYPDETLHNTETRWVFQDAKDKAINGLMHWSNPLIGDPSVSPQGANINSWPQSSSSFWANHSPSHWLVSSFSWIWLIVLSLAVGWLTIRQLKHQGSMSSRSNACVSINTPYVARSTGEEVHLTRDQLFV